MIREALGKLPHDAGPLLDLTQQQSPDVRRNRPAVKPSHHFLPPKGFKSKRPPVTLRLYRLPPCYWHKLSQQHLCQRRQPIAIGVVRNAGQASVLVQLPPQPLCRLSHNSTPVFAPITLTAETPENAGHI